MMTSQHVELFIMLFTSLLAIERSIAYLADLGHVSFLW